MSKARVSVTAPDAFKDGLEFNGTTLAALQIVGILKSLPYYKRRQAMTTALAILKAAGENCTVDDWSHK